MDSLGALALATEPPNEALMKHLPEGRTSPLITFTMIKNGLGMGMYHTILLLWLTLSDGSLQILGVSEMAGRAHYTMIFNIFIWLQLFNLIHCRRIHDEHNILGGISQSWTFAIIWLIVAGTQYCMVEFGGEIVQTVSLSQDQWFFCLAVGATSLPCGFVIKTMWRERQTQYLELDVPEDIPKKTTRRRRTSSRTRRGRRQP